MANHRTPLVGPSGWPAGAHDQVAFVAVLNNNVPLYVINSTLASNSAGGVLGKMISLQSIAVAAAATGITVPQQSQLMRFTLKHSLFLATLVGLEVLVLAYWIRII